MQARGGPNGLILLGGQIVAEWGDTLRWTDPAAMDRFMGLVMAAIAAG